MKKIIILGSTGSIGTQSVEIATKNKDRYQVEAISTNKNVALALKQATQLNCKNILVADNDAANQIENQLPSGIKLFKGNDNIERLLEIEADLVINAVVGSVGLEATLFVLKQNRTLALANKESLVVGGEIIKRHYGNNIKNIIPVDSEHSAIYQLFLGEQKEEVSNIILTASGGPFRGWSLEEMQKVSVEQALAHPRWKMGPKITIDSATLVNKGLEVLEAHYLFEASFEKIQVLIHPQSIIHSMVEFIDGSVKAHLGPTDMRIPIQYALSHPDRDAAPAGFANFAKEGNLTFEDVDYNKFRALKIAFDAGNSKKGYPIVYNGANEVGVAAFLDKKIGFLQIIEVIERVMEKHIPQDSDEIETVKEIDLWAKDTALKVIKENA